MWAVVAASGVAGALAGAHPTGQHLADPVLSAAFAGVVALAGAYARRWAWLVAGGVAVVASGGRVAVICAVAAVLVSFLAVAINVRSAAMGATAAGLAVQALLRLPDIGMLGGSAIVATLAIVPLAISGYRYAPRRARRWTRRVLKYAVVLVIVIIGFGVAVALQARGRIDDGIKHAAAGFDAIGNGDRQLAVQELQQASAAFDDASTISSGWWSIPIRAMPIAGQQFQAVITMAQGGRDLTFVGARAADAIDYEELRVKGGAINLDLIQRAQLPIVATARVLAKTEERLDALDVNWLLPPIRDKFDLLHDEIGRALPAANIARDVVNAAPTILGAETPQHYLVLFGTPAETRELGGFVGNYAEVVADKGKLTLAHSGRSLELSDPSGKHAYTLRDGVYQEPFAPYRVNQFFGNVSASANFTDVADVAAQLYPQATGQPLDGVFYMDPYSLAALLDLTGPITLQNGDIKLTAKNAAQTLLVDQYTQLTEKKERVDFLDEATRVAFEKLTSGDLPKPAKVANVMSPMVDQGHLFGFSSHDDVEPLFRALALDGAAPDPAGGDLLWVTQTNENPSKIDAYLQRDITYAASVRPDTGQVDADVTIKLTNTAPAGLPDDVIGNAHGDPVGTNHMFLTLYSPLRATNATVDGNAVSVGAVKRFGLSAFTVVVDVPAGQSTTMVMHLTGVVARGDAYRLVVVRQPTVKPDAIAVEVTGRAGWSVRDSGGMKVTGNTGKLTVGADRINRIDAEFNGR